jgi:hypothetical protein
MSRCSEALDIDGVIAASGPDLEWEIEPYLNKCLPIAAINHAPFRLKLKEHVHWFHNDTVNVEDLLEESRKYEYAQYLHYVPFEQKQRKFDGSHKRMYVNDYPPYLVDHAFTVFTALHFLICKGCKNIFGAGVNLKNWPDGSYDQIHFCPRDEIFKDIRHKYLVFIEPDLKRLGVKFTSSGLR